MRTRGSRLNNGYIGDYAPHDDVNGVVSLNKKYLVNEYSIESVSWERPSQWRQGPSVSEGEQKIVITNAVYNTDNNFTAFTIAGATFNVDWGDGTTGSFSSSATASKNYDKTTYSGLTSEVFRGYKTLNIVITPQAGATFNGAINFAVKHPQSGLQSYYSSGYLEIIMSAPSATSLIVSDTTFNNRSSARLLEHFRWIGNANLSGAGVQAAFIGCNNLKIISAFPSTRNCTDFQSTFHTCHSLEWIPPSLCETQNATNMAFMFFLCNALKKVPGTFNTSKVTGSMRQLFQDCLMLKRIPYMDTSKVTADGLVGLFSGCSSLEEAPPLIDAGSATQLFSMFNSCRNLKNFPKIINTSNVTNFSSMFLGCNSMEVAPYVDTTKGITFDNMYNSCGIRRFAPEWGNTFNMPQASTTANMFRFSRALETVPDVFVTGSTFNNCSEMFYECYGLKACPLITDISNCRNLTGMFFNCRALKEIPGMTISSNANNFGGTSTTTRMFFQNWNLSSCGLTGFTGANVSFEACSLGTTALNDIYRSLRTVGASGANAFSITVTSNWGNVADDTSIAIAKGWQVLG